MAATRATTPVVPPIVIELGRPIPPAARVALEAAIRVTVERCAAEEQVERATQLLRLAIHKIRQVNA